MVPQVRGGSWKNTHQNGAMLGVRPRGEPQRGAKAFRKGPWSASETEMLEDYVRQNGPRNWSNIHKHSMLRRNGKSCRLRWFNHLRSNLRKCPFSLEEERRIIELHYKIGNKWAKIARVLNGRTDNDVKNFWNTRLKKCKREGLPVYPLDIQQNESPNYSIPIHQSPNFGNPLVPVLDAFSFGSPTSPYIPDISLIKHIHNDNNINKNFSNPSFPRTPSDMSCYHQVLSTPYFKIFHSKQNDTYFDGANFSQTREKREGIDDSGRMEDPNVIDLKLSFKIGDSDITKINHLDNSSSDNSSYQQFDEELAALLDSSIPSPTLDW